MLRLKSPKMLGNRDPGGMKGSKHVTLYIDTSVN